MVLCVCKFVAIYILELKTFAQDFVFGYIQAMDGERVRQIDLCDSVCLFGCLVRIHGTYFLHSIVPR